MSYPRISRSSFSGILITACLGLALAGCLQGPPRDEPVLVMQRHVSFPEIGLVEKRIREECNIATNLSGDIRYYAKQHYSRIDLVDAVSATTPGTVLYVKISTLKGGDRGASWARRPFMMVEGTLWQSGAKVGSFVAQRESQRTVDSCMSLARVSRALGKDIGEWLASPTMDARLGDSK